jgi:hypothetical protein
MMVSRNFNWHTAVLALLVFLGVAIPALAGGTRVYTNQTYIEEARIAPEFAIADKVAVFRLILGSLPDKVTVYPTENYYYFSFHHSGIKYAGNIRFDAEDRDQGLIHFNYFKDFTFWQRDEGDFSAVLGSKDGVAVKSTGRLAYDVTFEDKRVTFQLNDLSGVKPPPDAVTKDETYIGPVFDESGIRFFLVFNEELKTFHYILDESAPAADQYNIARVSDRITIGIRSGFAFYADRFSNRKILVGVNQINTSINNYFDGPFDQLPDNFIEGDTLQKAILSASPEMAGQIDRFGNSPDGETRYLIAPYLQYEDESDLGIISQCAASEALPIYYNCFSYIGSGDAENGEPAPENPPE